MDSRGHVRIVILTNDEEVLTQAVIADTLAEAKLRFGRSADRVELTRKAVEAATELLGKPAQVLDYLPRLAIGEARRNVVQ